MSTGSAPTPGPLLADDEELNRCVACGLCLPSCPTWRVTGREAASPRGRIAAMQAVQWRGAPLDGAFATMMEECVQCRACEPVCPAFVPFGHLMEGARAALRQGGPRSTARRIGEWVGLRLVLPRRPALATLTWLLWLLQCLRLVPRRTGLPRLRARSLGRPMHPSPGAGDAVVLFTGCVMDAWMRDTHRAAQRVIEAAGARVDLPGRGAACCGALHLHSGRIDEARRLAARVVASMPGDTPVLVDSAGCAAVMGEYGRLLGTPGGEAFAGRVHEVHEWLAGRDLQGLVATGRAVVVQDPCHLRNVRRSEAEVRSVLGLAYELEETDDLGLCCGAGGAYSALQPRLATAIRDAKVQAINRAGGERAVVASANPGCLMHLRAGGVDARHPMELLADALTDVSGNDRTNRADPGKEASDA